MLIYNKKDHTFYTDISPYSRIDQKALKFLMIQSRMLQRANLKNFQSLYNMIYTDDRYIENNYLDYTIRTCDPEDFYYWYPYSCGWILSCQKSYFQNILDKVKQNPKDDLSGLWLIEFKEKPVIIIKRKLGFFPVLFYKSYYYEPTDDDIIDGE